MCSPTLGRSVRSRIDWRLLKPIQSTENYRVFMGSEQIMLYLRDKKKKEGAGILSKQNLSLNMIFMNKIKKNSVLKPFFSSNDVWVCAYLIFKPHIKHP